MHYVLNKLNEKYTAQGGPAYFGFPTTDQEDIFSRYGRVGVANSFTKGQIVLSEGAQSATWMDSAIAAKWNRQAYPVYGMPIADQVAVEGGARVNLTPPRSTAQQSTAPMQLFRVTATPLATTC